MKLRRLCVVFCICVFTPFPTNNPRASLAVSSATLSGRVTDPQGSVIVGAKVDVTNVATNATFSSETNGEGFFVISNIPPGRYRVTVEKQGFQSIIKPNVELHVQDTIALNFEMQVGSIIQSVMVESGAPLIKTENAEVSTLVNRQFVENLPLNGRSFQSLIALSPGVVLTKAGISEQGQFSVNGQRANANYFTVDGVSANVGVSALNSPGQSGAGSLPALSASGGTNNLVSVDALEEFKIQTSTYAPEFGRTPGAQVSIVTRSGTNAFHGSMFNYFRNDALDATDWFANANRQPKPPLRQNDFGGVLGGPIFKDKTFFFFSYEGLRLRQPQVGVTTVPSLATRQAAPQSVQPLLNLYPKPNGPEVGNGLATFSSSFSNPTTLNATSMRVDGNVSSNLTLFGRYNYAPSETNGRGIASSTLNTLTYLKANTQTLTLGATYILTPAISNELRFNYSRYKAESFFTLDDFGGAVVPSESVFFPSDRSTEDAGFTFQLTGTQSGVVQWGRSPKHVQRQFNIIDSISVVWGNHQLKFGIDYRRLWPIFRVPEYSQLLLFSSVGNPISPQPGTALSGRLSLAAITSRTSKQVVIFNNFSAYAQDTWKVAPKLTLTYGLRWEVNPPPHEANGNDPLTLIQIDDPAGFAFAPRGTPLWKTTYTNFAPRAGISYQFSSEPGRETVLRGGFGLFYDLGEGQAANAFIASFPFSAVRTMTNVPFPLSPGNAAPPIVGPTPGSSFFYAFDPELELPRVFQWNAAVEQSLGVNQSITASYVAAVGRRLLRLERLINSSPSFPGVVSIAKNDATSDYHAMQLQFQRRLAKGFQALASYTWAKSLDIVSGDSVNTNPANRVDPRLDRGPSDFDVRHAFNGAITYNVPVSAVGNIGGKILSGWSVDGIFIARTATPVNITYPRSIPGAGSFTFRPDLIPGIPLYLDDPAAPGGRRFNNTRITVPGNPLPQLGPFLRPVEARQGTLGRNLLRGFPVWQLDFSLRRQFNLTERVTLQFRVELFNVFNHPNFGDPEGSLNNSLFGQSQFMLGRTLGTGGLTGGFNPLYQVGGPRSIQLSLRLNF